MTTDKTGKEGDRGAMAPGLSLQENLSQPSAAEQLTSKIEVDKQYAGTDVKKMVEVALAADGREQKDRAVRAEGEVIRLTGELNGMTNQITTLSGQMVEITKAQNDAELAKYSEDVPAQTAIRVKQANAAEKFRLEGIEATQVARDTKFAEQEVTFAKQQTALSIKLAAIAGGVDETALADLVPDGNAIGLTRAVPLLKAQPVADPNDPSKSKPPPGLTNVPVAVIGSGGESKSMARVMLDKARQK